MDHAGPVDPGGEGGGADPGGLRVWVIERQQVFDGLAVAGTGTVLLEPGHGGLGLREHADVQQTAEGGCRRWRGGSRWGPLWTSRRFPVGRLTVGGPWRRGLTPSVRPWRGRDAGREDGGRRRGRR